jgi:hypothetical protein
MSYLRLLNPEQRLTQAIGPLPTPQKPTRGGEYAEIFADRTV